MYVAMHACTRTCMYGTMAIYNYSYVPDWSLKLPSRNLTSESNFLSGFPMHTLQLSILSKTLLRLEVSFSTAGEPLNKAHLETSVDSPR